MATIKKMVAFNRKGCPRTAARRAKKSGKRPAKPLKPGRHHPNLDKTWSGHDRGLPSVDNAAE